LAFLVHADLGVEHLGLRATVSQDSGLVVEHWGPLDAASQDTFPIRFWSMQAWVKYTEGCVDTASQVPCPWRFWFMRALVWGTGGWADTASQDAGPWRFWSLGPWCGHSRYHLGPAFGDSLLLAFLCGYQGRLSQDQKWSAFVSCPSGLVWRSLAPIGLEVLPCLVLGSAFTASVVCWLQAWWRFAWCSTAVSSLGGESGFIVVPMSLTN
jgi:hypothetical protein